MATVCFTRLEGREGRECRARYSQNWLLRVKSSALVTGFVLAEGTHQTRCLFDEFQFRNIDISKKYQHMSLHSLAVDNIHPLLNISEPACATLYYN